MDSNLRFYEKFETHFGELYGPLCHFAFTYVKDTELSEDIVQEVFTRIWERRKDLLLGDSIRFYLFTAVRNNCISHLRQQKNSTVSAQVNGDAGYYPVVPPKETGDNTDYQQLLQEAINELPGKCREIFILSRLSNMKYKEIAETLDISPKTVENQISKALKLMRGFLKKKGIPTIW